MTSLCIAWWLSGLLGFVSFRMKMIRIKEWNFYNKTAAFFMMCFIGPIFFLLETLEAQGLIEEYRGK